MFQEYYVQFCDGFKMFMSLDLERDQTCQLLEIEKEYGPIQKMEAVA